jgi:uncharacterized protein involved in exopolysaccharide biosynthesis
MVLLRLNASLKIHRKKSKMHVKEEKEEAGTFVRGQKIYVKAFLDEPDKNFSFIDIFTLIRSFRWLLVIALVAGCLVGLLVSFLSTPSYRAKTVFEYSEQDSSSTPSGLGGALGSVASLAGLGIGQSNGRTYAVGRLQSQSLMMDYLQTTGALRLLYASQWSAAEKKFKSDSSGKVPTLLQGYKKFEKDVASISTDTRTQLITLEIHWSDPVQATKWANEYIQFASNALRQNKMQETTRTLGLLQAELARAELPELRTAIVKLIQDQIRQRMLASVPETYGFRIIDSAVVPEKPFKPVLVLLVVAGGALGVFFGLFIGFVRYMSGSRNKNSAE